MKFAREDDSVRQFKGMIKIKKILNKIINLIYPNACGICDQICEEGICENCKEKIEKIILCKKDIYKDNNIFYNEHMYLFNYIDDVRSKIIEYKFNEKTYMYKAFAQIFINNEKTCDFLKSYDIIIPVPIHKKRNNLRGYNQSTLIAKEISKEIQNLSIENSVLYKCKNTNSQSQLNRNQRIQNVKDVYQIKNEQIIKNKNIIIFDDIYTTGSTVNECARILKKAGAAKIGILTIAKD